MGRFLRRPGVAIGHGSKLLDTHDSHRTYGLIVLSPGTTSKCFWLKVQRGTLSDIATCATSMSSTPIAFFRWTDASTRYANSKDDGSSQMILHASSHCSV